MKSEVCATVVGVLNSDYNKQWLIALAFGLRSKIRASDVAVPTPVLNFLKTSQVRDRILQ